MKINDAKLMAEFKDLKPGDVFFAHHTGFNIKTEFHDDRKGWASNAVGLEFGEHRIFDEADEVIPHLEATITIGGSR